MTYGQISKLLGRSGAGLAIGNALHKNKDPINVPCHRVVNRNGNLAKNFGMGGASAQKRRLVREGVLVEGNRADLKKYQHAF